MLTPSDVRMAKLKSAINRCRHGDLSTMFGLEVACADLITISALAKATGDAFTFNLTQRLLASMEIRRSQ